MRTAKFGPDLRLRVVKARIRAKRETAKHTVFWTAGDSLTAHVIHHIHKWRTRGKRLVPSHESEALEGGQKCANEDFQ